MNTLNTARQLAAVGCRAPGVAKAVELLRAPLPAGLEHGPADAEIGELVALVHTGQLDAEGLASRVAALHARRSPITASVRRGVQAARERDALQALKADAKLLTRELVDLEAGAVAAIDQAEAALRAAGARFPAEEPMVIGFKSKAQTAYDSALSAGGRALDAYNEWISATRYCQQVRRVYTECCTADIVPWPTLTKEQQAERDRINKAVFPSYRRAS